MVLEKFDEVIRKDVAESVQSIVGTIADTLTLKDVNLKHVAVTMEATDKDSGYVIKNKTTLEELYALRNRKIKWLVDLQVKLNLPILTIHLMPAELKDAEQKSIMNEHITSLLVELSNKKILVNSQIKLTVLGKWYSLTSNLVDQIKKTIDETKDFDKFFLNFCINYSGQEEIVDACKLIAMKVASEKLNPDAINKEIIKENIYSSYFIPPQLIIKNGERKNTDLLLWDAPDAKLLFTDKPWQEFKQQDFLKAVGNY